MSAMSAPGVRLITAASDGDKKGVKKWLDKGVDVDSRDWDKLTPLIAASSQGHLVRPMLIELRQQNLLLSGSRGSITLKKEKCMVEVLPSMVTIDARYLLPSTFSENNAKELSQAAGEIEIGFLIDRARLSERYSLPELDVIAKYIVWFWPRRTGGFSYLMTPDDT